MKIKELFEENSKYEALVNTLKSKCARNFEALVNGHAEVLYRGTSQPNYVMLPDGYIYLISGSSSSPRASATGKNLVLDYVSSSPAWSDIPKRSLSVSATPSIVHAYKFRDAWLIVPFDNASALAAINEDFNYFQLPDGELMDLPARIDDVRSTAVLAGNSSTTPKSLAALCREPIFDVDENRRWKLSEIQKLSDAIEKLFYWFDDNIAEIEDGSPAQDLENELSILEETINGRSLWVFLETKITPDNMGIELYDYDNSAGLPRQAEVWFEGDYVAMKPSNSILQSDWFSKLKKDVLG